jgi:GT2 family glycosyltransferase
MDNDTAVCTPDWLARLVAEFTRDPRLGIVGPKLIYPFAPHPIQCAGVGINPLGRIRFRGRGRPRHDPEYVQPAEVPALISACWMMPNSFLTELGGLDPLFHPVQYEDLDYCVRVTQAGYRCRYTPAVEMYHFEGRTTGAGGKEQYVRVIAANSLKFRQKWRSVLAALPPDPADYRWCPDAELGLTDTLDLSLQPGP